MFDRHEFFGRAMPAAASLAPAAIAGAQTSPTPTANSTARLNTFGPEADRLSRRSGLWDVVETVWDRPEGKPVATSGLVLERAMLGSMLQEILRPPRSRAHRHARVQSDGRAWDYVSFDTRAPEGPMPAILLFSNVEAQKFARRRRDPVSLELTE